MRKGMGVAGRWGPGLWVAGSAASVLVLPWYGIGEESSAGAASALVQGLSGYRWLLGLLLPPCLAAVATGLFGRRQPRLVVWAGLAGIAWLGLEAFAIGGHGWRFGWLAGLAGGAPAQPALGWGAALYALSMLVLVAYGLAWRGWCKGDVFIVSSIAIVCGSILVFVFYPVACILLSAFQDNAGHFDLGLFLRKVTDSSIWGLGCVTGGRNCGVAWNSLAEAIIVGVLTTLLGLAFALVSARTRVRYKRLLRLLSVLPVITPPFVIGMSLILLFGRAGMVTVALNDWFGVPRSRWIYGMSGLTIAQLLAFTPISYLVLLGVLGGVSPSLEEASQTLRSGRWRTFRAVTWPLIRPGLANAFLIGFIESLADFGNPMMIGGNFRVLSTGVYFAVVGAAQDQGQAAVLAIVLLLFTLSAFLLQRLPGSAGAATSP